MQHHIFSTFPVPEIAILIKESAFTRSSVLRYYITPLEKHITADKLIALSLKYNPNNKISAKEAKAYITDNLLPAIKIQGIKYLLVADATYFKYLSGAKKTESAYGYTYDCIITR